MYTNDAKEFTGLFFQDNIMKVTYAACPELIMVDATYTLNELRIPLYLILIVDGNGKSEIVGLYLTSLETREAISEMVRWFKNHNSPRKSTIVILTDKDFVEKSELLLCFFHTLQRFRREITFEKMGFCLCKSSHVLELCQKLAYSKSEADYN